MSDVLVPVQGCWVVKCGTTTPLGLVIAVDSHAEMPQLTIQWPGGSNETLAVEDVTSGLQLGWTVQDVPLSATRTPLGLGTVVSVREIGGCQQGLVQLHSTGNSVWLPWQSIVRVKDVRVRFARAEQKAVDAPQRFQLKLLAHALESWNMLTGALDRLDVDPLPHQIHLVHRILSSGNHNWLIADDVGLGKTIEVGLLLAALKRKGFARRVLVIAPAGLTRQWQDEMKFKFDQFYQIYAQDFNINDPQNWKMYDHVIASIDLVKRQGHLDIIRQAGNWDVVIFDEGHKLTRYDSGERSDRFKLAESLRPLSETFLLLTGTPHQGFEDRFRALLELVRPDLRQEIRNIKDNPDIAGEIILRNRKSKVTDADGNLIFHGLKVHRIAVETSQQARKFDKLLRDYLTQGYRAGASGGNKSRAIGFVMTTFRKLASSSIAAIENALLRRRERLLNHEGTQKKRALLPDTDEEEFADGGDNQDALGDISTLTEPKAFFEREMEMLGPLLEQAMAARRHDEKLDVFLNEVVENLDRDGKKLLVFTEYRATQSYLKAEIERRYPHAGAVLLINGSMKLEEKLQVIKDFNTGSNRFLISTEAGGEGLNLQQACHTMVNYDLPWNPARLVQRMGRLYRYGQKLPVIVFNLHAKDNFDNAAIDLMMTRVESIVQSMSQVGEEFGEGYEAEILGEVLEQINLAAVLNSAVDFKPERTNLEIEAAIKNAERARDMQKVYFSHVSGFDKDALKGTQGLTMHHVNSFIRGMMDVEGIEITGEMHGKRTLEVRLPDRMKGAFPAFGQRTVLRFTTDRRVAQDHNDLVLLDFEHPFFQHLISKAQSEEFDGIYSSVRSGEARKGTLAAYKLRWQNDQGSTLAEEFLSVFRSEDGTTECNPSFLLPLLTSAAISQAPESKDQMSRAKLFDQLNKVADTRLGAESTKFKHPNSLVPIACADLYA
jgi:ERCC4-related helicase